MERQPRSVFPGFADRDEVAADAADLVQALARRRRQQGLSQTAVAARMGTSQSAVARLEADASDLRLSTLQRYAAAIDVELGFAMRAVVEGD